MSRIAFLLYRINSLMHQSNPLDMQVYCPGYNVYRRSIHLVSGFNIGKNPNFATSDLYPFPELVPFTSSSAAFLSSEPTVASCPRLEVEDPKNLLESHKITVKNMHCPKSVNQAELPSQEAILSEASDEQQTLRLSGQFSSLDHLDSFHYMAPLMKTLLSEYSEVLQLGRLTPNLPLDSNRFYEDFRAYSAIPGGEWNRFIAENVGILYLTQMSYLGHL
ncbi:unnamed protein product [Protopolystoma xenopodis]|uniref:Uncharacterized protein n=1 Tax=Protopolystoma xenopodis TaxID=117903 RepID=A0A3S5AMH2_9PLAT|nr:unnamed protein product [Protopolystoma xenopodis]